MVPSSLCRYSSTVHSKHCETCLLSLKTKVLFTEDSGFASANINEQVEYITWFSTSWTAIGLWAVASITPETLRMPKNIHRSSMFNLRVATTTHATRRIHVSIFFQNLKFHKAELNMAEFASIDNSNKRFELRRSVELCKNGGEGVKCLSFI